jgi:UDP-N-acetylmuramoyl-tripeptide--D-alanyl-D-alanine ligase
MSGWSYALNDLAHILGAAPEYGDKTFSSVSTDTRALRPGDVFFALSGPNFDGNAFVAEAFAKGASAVVASVPNENGDCVIVDDPLKALQTFAARHRDRQRCRVFALTGSCGKTSTKDLVSELLATRFNVVKTRGNLNNEIGCPLSLLQIDDRTDIAVIEMGANHPGEIAGLCSLAKPSESAITMIAPAHLEGFGSIENVAKAKGEIVEGTDPHGTFYVNTDDPWCVHIAESFPGRKVRFGSSGDVTLDSLRVIGPCEMEMHVSPIGMLRLPLACRAHARNVLLAVAVGLEHGVDAFEEPLRRASLSLSRFKVKTVGPLTVIDDTYNANPASMAASLEALADWPGSGAKIAALGEMLELGAHAAKLHRDIGVKAGRLGISALFARGQHACDMIEGARAENIPFAEMIDAPQDLACSIKRMANPGDVLLVKGSRGMRMELVIEALQELYS